MNQDREPKQDSSASPEAENDLFVSLQDYVDNRNETVHDPGLQASQKLELENPPEPKRSAFWKKRKKNNHSFHIEETRNHPVQDSLEQNHNQDHIRNSAQPEGDLAQDAPVLDVSDLFDNSLEPADQTKSQDSSEGMDHHSPGLKKANDYAGTDHLQEDQAEMEEFEPEIHFSRTLEISNMDEENPDKEESEENQDNLVNLNRSDSLPSAHSESGGSVFGDKISARLNSDEESEQENGKNQTEDRTSLQDSKGLSDDMDLAESTDQKAETVLNANEDHKTEANQKANPDQNDHAVQKADANLTNDEAAEALNSDKKEVQGHSDNYENGDQDAPDNDDYIEEEEPEEDWTDKMREVYSRHQSIWIRPWIYMVLLAAVFWVWMLTDMNSLGLYEYSQPMMIFAIGVLVLGIAGFCMIYGKRWYFKALAIVLCLGVVVYSVMGIHGAASLGAEVRKMANPNTPISIPASIYYYKQAPVTSLEALNGHTVGVLSKNKDINKQINDQIKEKGIRLRLRSFDSFTSLMLALRGQAIRAVILTGTDPLIANEFSGLENTSQQLAILESFPAAEPLYNVGSQLDPAKDPFTILLSGQMDPTDGSSVRSYLNLVIAVNPNTHTILKIFVPRNLKLPVVCEAGLGCLPDEEDKVSLASYHSILALKDTLATALNVNIDFTMQVDVDWMIAGLAAQDTLELEELHGYGAITKADSGISKDFNGLSARKLKDIMQDFSSADLEYEAGQLDLMMYMLTDYMNRSSKDLKATLQELSSCVTTSFTYEQLLHLLQLFALHDYKWDSYGYGISSKESWENSKGLASKAYMLIPDVDSLNNAASDLEAVLKGEKPSHAYTVEDLKNLQDVMPVPGENIPNGKDIIKPTEPKPEVSKPKKDNKDKTDQNKPEDQTDQNQTDQPQVDVPVYDPNAGATAQPGYYDEYGGYYDQYGGYWDVYGGYYDAYGNYTNPDGTPGYSTPSYANPYNYGYDQSAAGYYDPSLYGYGYN